jgi:hypothetical protein
MNKDGLYHQPRWVNAIVIAAGVPIVLSQFVMPTGLARLVAVGASLFVFLFVGICNKLRSGAVFPLWAEAASLSDRLKTENARRITEADSQSSRQMFQPMTGNR